MLLSLGIGVAVIAWSITVREDLGSPSPRQHTRYLEPLLIPLLAVTLDTLDEKLTKTRRRILAALTIAWGVLFVAVCRAIGAGAGDNTLCSGLTSWRTVRTACPCWGRGRGWRYGVQ